MQATSSFRTAISRECTESELMDTLLPKLSGVMQFFIVPVCTSILASQ
jgi:hypothetical protein